MANDRVIEGKLGEGEDSLTIRFTGCPCKIAILSELVRTGVESIKANTVELKKRKKPCGCGGKKISADRR